MIKCVLFSMLLAVCGPEDKAQECATFIVERYKIDLLYIVTTPDFEAETGYLHLKSLGCWIRIERPAPMRKEYR